MKNFSFTMPGREWNEDRVYVCNDYGFVIDGATSLTDEHYSNFKTDAEWYANFWYEYLKTELAQKNPLKSTLKHGIELIKNEYKNLLNGAAAHSFPSASLSLVRDMGDMVELYVIGDCPILIQTKYFTTFYMKDTRNNINDAVVSEIIKDYAVRENIPFLESRKRHADVIMAGRKKNNKFGGAYVLRSESNAIDYGFYYQIPKRLLNKIIIMSDGYSEILDTFMLKDERTFMSELNSVSDAKSLYNLLRKNQNADKNCEKYTRFKISDDSSLVCLFF